MKKMDFEIGVKSFDFITNFQTKGFLARRIAQNDQIRLQK